MREIYRTPYFLLTVDDEKRLLRRARTDLAFPALAEAETSYDAMLLSIEHIPRDRFALLADMRLAPARNDDAFEALVARYYARLYSGFRRAAALVKTQVGRLQLGRMSEASGIRVPAFVDEAAAMTYLEAEGEPSWRGPVSSMRGR